MQLYLVRHGETDWNAAHRIQGSTDIPLNDTGRDQAAATGRLLAQRRWDAIYSSPLVRAFETASIIADTIGLGAPLPVPEIVERNYGEAEGLTGDEIDRRFPGETPVPGRETREEVIARVLPALLELAERHSGESVIVVGHGGVIRSVLYALDPNRWHGPISNGSVHSFRHDDGSFELIAFDDPLDAESLGLGTEELDVQNELEHRESPGMAR